MLHTHIERNTLGHWGEPNVQKFQILSSLAKADRSQVRNLERKVLGGSCL